MILPIVVLVPSQEKLIRGTVVTVSEFTENSILFVDTTPFVSIPYVPRSRCVVVRRGGFTSHVAIVCRELGVPCVRCDSDLEPGTRIEIDFEKEVLKILPKSI